MNKSAGNLWMVNKVMSLEQAIKDNIRPGMTLHLSLQAGAAARELARQFWGQKPDFTLIMNMIGGHHALSLVHGGLIKKLIFATCADIYPRPTPNPIIQRAFRDKTCKLENWSMLSLTLALMAGALSLPFIPTRSVIGSSLAEDNRHAFKVVDDAFGSGEKIGLIKSLCPDVSMIHGWAADAMGNVILSGPPRDSWAAKASKKGIIACVEKIVSEDFITQHSMLVKIPASLVSAVCLTPFGSHPQNMSAQNFPEFEGYGLDHSFLKALRKASEDSEACDRWVKEWVLGCPSHEDYLKKLGEKCLEALKHNSNPTASVSQEKQPQEEFARRAEATAAERAIINGARVIKDIVLKHRYKTMFAGIGLSGLAGWCAYYLLKEEGYHVDLIAAGFGYEPCPGDPLLISEANLATARMISDSLDLHGVGVGGINSSCLGVLGAGQIDKYGNINSTIMQSRKGHESYLAGAGGGNDIATLAREVVVVAVYRPNRMVQKVEYITCPGTRVSTLATDEGTYVKEDSEFALKAYFPKPEVSDEKKRIEEISSHCGWELHTSPPLQNLLPPTPEELQLLRSFDPDGVFLK